MTAVPSESSFATAGSRTMARVLERNVEALLERRRAEEKAMRLEERIADAMTRFSGSMLFVYLHLTFFGLWIIVNLGWLFIRPFDPSFVILAMVASVEAIFLSTFVLITQNRIAAAADKRAELDLQVSLLAEHEVTHVIKLLTAIAERLGVEEAADPELAELAEDVAPEAVLDTLEKKLNQPQERK